MNRVNYGFYILVLSGIAAGSTVIALLHRVSPLFASRALFLCQKFISNTMFEIPRSLPNLFILAVGIILGIGSLSLLLQLIKTHILLRKLLANKVDLSRDLTEVMTTLGLKNKIILVNDDNLFSFCGGIFSPFIMITTGLVKSLTKKELEAVLLHEQSHLVGRDPIKILIGKTFSAMFFFLPVFADLYKNIEAVNELLADQWTIDYQQKTVFLRRALKKILVAPQLNLAAVSNISSLDYFEIRIHHLINPGVKHRLNLSLISLATTLLFMLSSWFLLRTPANAFHMDMGSKDSSIYFLCSMEQSCSDQCHFSYSFLPEKKCSNDLAK